MQIHFPVPLGIDVGRQVHARQFACKTNPVFVDHVLIVVIAPCGIGLEHLKNLRRLLGAKNLAAPLIVHHRLCIDVFRRGDIKLAIKNGIACRILVHIGGPVTNPLARHKNRQFHVQFDFTHFKWRGMPMTHEIADQPLVVLNRLRPLAIADPCCLTDRCIVAHIVDNTYKTVVQNRYRLVKVLFDAIAHNPQSWGRR